MLRPKPPSEVAREQGTQRLRIGRLTQRRRTAEREMSGATCLVT